jgi:hypothetical protein
MDKITVIDSVQRDSSINEIIHDTLYIEEPYEIIVIKDSIVYRDIYVPVDTSAILKMFKNVYYDTLKLDYGYIALKDSINNNTITHRSFVPKLKMPINEKIVTLKEEPQNKVFVGIDGAMDRPNYVYSLGSSLLYQTKGDKIYEIGIGVRNRVIDGNTGLFIPYIRGGVYWKISKNK